jgi:hypothetical protein
LLRSPRVSIRSAAPTWDLRSDEINDEGVIEVEIHRAPEGLATRMARIFRSGIQLSFFFPQNGDRMKPEKEGCFLDA